MVDTVPTSTSTFQTQASKRLSSSQPSPGQSNPNDMPVKSPMVIHANGTTTNGNNKTDSYSYSYTYKKAAEDTGTGIPGMSTVEVNETVTEEIGPDGTKIIRRHQQEKQINKVTQVVTQRVIKRQYIDPLTGKILEYDPNDERFVNLPPETVFEEHTIRSADDSPTPHQQQHQPQRMNVVIVPTGMSTQQQQQQQTNNSPKTTTPIIKRPIIKVDQIDTNRKPQVSINSNIKSNLHPEDNQGYPEEKNMDYDPDDVTYQDDPQYEGLIPDQINVNTKKATNGHVTSHHHQHHQLHDYSTVKTYGNIISNGAMNGSNGADYVSNHYTDPSSAYTYIGLGNGTQNGTNGHTSRTFEDVQQQQQQQQRYSLIQQSQQQVEANYDYGLESHYGTFSPQQRNFISRHQLIQQQDQIDQRTRSPSTDSSQVKVEQGWRNPDLEEVIEFLSHPSQEIRSNACAYLQHLCYQDDHIKTRTRQLGGIQKLISLILVEMLNVDVYRNACGALRNLSYGRLNDENKMDIKKNGGIHALIRLLKRTQDELTKENITAVLWNLSSCEDIKMSILDEGLGILVNQIIVPYAANNFHIYQRMNNMNLNGNGTVASNGRYKYDTNYPIVLTNTTGIIRNCSSTLQYSNCDARKKLRDCPDLIESLIKIIDFAIEPFISMQTSSSSPNEQEQAQMNLDSKCIENCCCILRNLSFRLQEIVDPQYDRDVKLMPFDGLDIQHTKKKKKMKKIEEDFFKNTYPYNMKVPQDNKSQELLWNLITINKYLIIIKESTIRDTIEACIGCIQNLTACYWLPSQQIRQEIRKLKGLPTLVYLLQSEKIDDEPIVSVTAIALRNLAIDMKNRELIGKYAMKHLISKLPDPKKPIPLRLNILNEDTITAALACINECVKCSDEFAKSCYNEGGATRMIFITRNGQSFPPKIVKYACHVLLSLWKHKNLHDLFKKDGYKESDYTSIAKQMGIKSQNPSPVNTLHRPRGDMGMKISYNSTANTSKSKQRVQQQQHYQIQQNNFNTLKQMNNDHIDTPLYSQVQKGGQINQSTQNRSLIITNGTTNADSWV